MKNLMFVLTFLSVGMIAVMGQNKTESRVELDIEFAQKAYESGLVEMELGKLASKKGDTEVVRNYGRMMAEDHGKSNMEIMALTGKEVKFNLNLPDQEKKEKENLSGMEGKIFDQNYMSKMVMDHKKAIQLVENELKKDYRKELKDWLSSTLNQLKQHLQKAEQIFKNLK
jgi:putative membrane protein